jgi:hypothetical protein
MASSSSADSSGGGGSNFGVYLKQSFQGWAHPWKEEIPEADIRGTYNLFVPMRAWGRGAVGFRDLSQVPVMRAAASAYSTAFQLMMESLRYLPQTGTAKAELSSSFPYTRKDGTTVRMPKMRALLHLVAKKTHPNLADPGSDVLPDHELHAPSNLLGIWFQIINHDPELELIDLLELVVANTAAGKPAERQAYLQEELKVLEKLNQVLGKARDEQRDSDESSDDDAEGDAGGEGDKKKKKKKKKRSSGRRRLPPIAKKDPVEGHLTFKDIDELTKAVAVLVDTATGNNNVRDNRKYACRADLVAAIRGKLPADAAVNLETQLGIDATLARINEYAKSLEDAATTSDQLVITEYRAVRDIPWAPWMAAPAAPPADGDATPPPMHHLHPNVVPQNMFKVPIPCLTWELKPEQASAMSLMKSRFPWKRTDVGMIFASIASRCLNMKLEQVLRLASITTSQKRGTQRQQQQQDGLPPPNDGIDNAAKVAMMMGLRHPGDVPGIDGDAMETEEDWSPYPLLGIDIVISKNRPLGRKANAIKAVVRGYLASRESELQKDIDRLLGGLKQKRRAEKRSCSQKKNKKRKTADGGPAAGADAAYNEGVERAKEDWGPDPETEERSIFSSSSDDEEIRQEEEEAITRVGAQIKKIHEEIKTVRSQCFMAIAEIEEAALYEMVTMLETASCVPDSVRSCSLWVNRHDDMTLDYEPTFKNIGPSGQVLATIALMLKRYGLATGQWPVTLMMIARDTGYISHLIGRIAMHLIVRGKYGGGKSKAMEVLERLSIKGAINSVTGASTQGMLPIYADAKKPEGDVTACYDEGNPLMTSKAKHMNMQEQKSMKELTAFMTKGRIEHMTNEKGEDGKIHLRKKIIEANIPIIYNTNVDSSGTSTEARAVSIFMPPNVLGPRNAMDIMCNPDSASGRDAAEMSSIELIFNKHNSFSMLVGKGMESGGVPVPDMEEFLITMEAVVQYLRGHHPDLCEKVRMVDVSHSMAAVLAMWVAIVLTFSNGFQPLDAAGQPIETPATTEAFDIMHLGRNVTPYLRVDPDVIMFIVAYVVYHSSNPEGNKMLRWATENHAHYPFVKTLKGQIKKNEKDNAAPLAPPPDDAPLAPDKFMRDHTDVLRELLTYQVCGVTNIPMTVPATGRRGAGYAVEGGGATKKLGARHQDDESMNMDQRMLRDYDEMEGPTVMLTAAGKKGGKDEQNEKATAILAGSALPKYEYKSEKAWVETGKGVTAVSTLALFHNPNYILIKGSLETIAQTYLNANRGNKMTEGHARDELGSLLKSTMMARQLPLVPYDRKKVLVEIEAYRAELWETRVCKRVPLTPVMIPCKRGFYVLVEALLDSPMHITQKVLRAICNKTTVERDVVLPIPFRHYPEVYKTFHATTGDRVLRCGNGGHMGTQMDSMPREVRERSAISGSHVRDATLEWNERSEIRAIKRFFTENGITNKDPELYTYRAIYTSRIIARQLRYPERFKNYPDDPIAEDKKLDDAARETSSQF